MVIRQREEKYKNIVLGNSRPGRRWENNIKKGI
jgi:hypothetical protein